MQTAMMLCHPTADEVCESVRKQHPAISRGTVYRNLNLLCEQGLLQKIRVSDGADHFDYRVNPHYHIRCRSCGKLVDADLPLPIDTESIPKESNGFTIEGIEVVYIGSCPDCKKNIISGGK